MLRLLALSAVLAIVVHGDTVTVPELDDDQLTSMYARDVEREPPPFAFGEKFITGARWVMWTMLQILRGMWGFGDF